MKRALILLLLALSALYQACTLERPPVATQYELGRVVRVGYIPEDYTSGYSTDGHVVSLSTSEQYVILLSCEHGGTYPITGDLAKDVMSRVQEEDSVRIGYQQDQSWGAKAGDLVTVSVTRWPR